jgi:hypothetical protein
VVKLTLTKALPHGMANAGTTEPTAKQPWAVKLADGMECVAFTGATGVVAGLGISYGCSDGGVLAGEPHRPSATWTIFFGSSFNAKTLAAQPIAQAWW